MTDERASYVTDRGSFDTHSIGSQLEAVETGDALLQGAHPLELKNGIDLPACVLTNIGQKPDKHGWRLGLASQTADGSLKYSYIGIDQLPGLDVVSTDGEFAKIKFQYFKQNIGYEKLKADNGKPTVQQTDFKREGYVVGIGYGVHEQHVNKIGGEPGKPEVPTPYFVIIQTNVNGANGGETDVEAESFAKRYADASLSERRALFSDPLNAKYFKQFPLSRIRHGPYGEPDEIKDTFKTF